MRVHAAPIGYYVYAHYRESDGKLFYIGKGKGRRAWSIQGRSEWWHRTYRKHGRYIVILHDGLTNAEACKVENKYISRCIGLPEVVNFLLGSEGIDPVSKLLAKRELIMREVRAGRFGLGLVCYDVLDDYRFQQRLTVDQVSTLSIMHVKHPDWSNLRVVQALIGAYPSALNLIHDAGAFAAMEAPLSQRLPG